MKRLATILLLMTAIMAAAQQPDSTLLQNNAGLNRMLQLQEDLTNLVFKQETSLLDRDTRLEILPTVKHTPGYGFSFGLGGAMSFYTRKNDYRLQRSTIPLSVSVAFTKPFSYQISLDPEIYFAGNAWRTGAEISYRNWLEYYFGVGYRLCHAPQYEKERYTYQSQLYRFKPHIQRQMGNPWLYGGIVADIWHERVEKPETFVAADPHYVALAGSDGKHSATGTGIGLSANFDTRDVPNDAFHGMYISAETMLYTTALGGNVRYGTLWFDYRQYQRIGHRKQVIAWNITSNNVFGNHVPFMRYATIGGVNNFRGYYNYQYRDKSILTTQVEYRYWFEVDNVWGILLNRLGLVAWVGTGAIGPNPVKYHALLPQAGAGARFALRDRLNFRFDLAHNSTDGEWMWYISFSEAF